MTDTLEQLKAQIAAIKASAELCGGIPWRVDTTDNAGKDWLLCYGQHYDEKTYIVTTDGVQGMDYSYGSDGAKAECEHTALCSPRNMLELADSFAALVVERERLRAENYRLKDALKEIRTNALTTIRNYEKNGPEYTSYRTGEQYYSASYVLAFSQEIAAVALTPPEAV